MLADVAPEPSPAVTSPAGPNQILDVTSTRPRHLAGDLLLGRIAAGEFSEVRHFHRWSPTQWDDLTGFLQRQQTRGRAAQMTLHGTFDNGASYCLLDAGSVVMALDRDYDGEWQVLIAGKSEAKAGAWYAAFDALLPFPPPPPPPAPLPDNIVPVRFWIESPMGGATRYMRNITIQDWSEIDGNYPSSVREDLGGLMAKDNPQGEGKIILFHGPPGTGKTRSILALMSEWRHWCQSSVVTDPERFFGNTLYLTDVLLSESSRKDWMLLVVEDGDEFMDVDAKSQSGQALSRLLNVADGIIGQGINLLTLITTNVPMDRLNPAVARDGRCMMSLEFPAFPEDEAAEWLSGHGVDGDAPDEPMTLAQMFSRVRGTQVESGSLEGSTE